MSSEGLSSPLDEPIRAGKRLGRYTLHHRIARGGMGAVYLASVEGPAGFERWFAVKLMHPHLSDTGNMVKRFHDEARVASHIQHPNVCSVIDFGKDGELLYLVMEYLAGEPLAQLAKRAEKDPLPVWMVLRTIADAARGLEAAHRLVSEDGQPLGLVHRDVSPQNLIVLYEGPTKVLDFGVARVRDQIATTNEGAMRGKLGYMSPEQIESMPLDRRSDVFSLGVVLWELLVGRRLFKRDTAVETLRAVLLGEPAAPSVHRPDLDPRVDALVLRALRHEPALRYPTAAAFADAIEETLAALGERSDHSRVAAEMGRRFTEERARKAAALVSVEAGETVTVVVDTEPSSLSFVREAVRARRPRWVLPLVAFAFLALGVGGTVVATQVASSPAAEPAQSPTAPAQAEPAPAPRETRAIDPTPAPIPDEPPPVEPPVEPLIEAPPATARRRGRRRGANVGPRAPAERTGQLNVMALPEAEVMIGGRRFGRTPLVGLRLPVGRHRVSLISTDGRRETVSVQIRDGSTTALSHRFRAR